MDLNHRHETAWRAIDALYRCHLVDSLQLCANYLADHETGGPMFGDLFGTVVGDALFWADCAPAHELAAYGGAAIDRLKGARLTLETRKRLFAQLWESFDQKDRQAFLSRVDHNGRFLRRVV